jgi:hypothetical protein
VPHQNRVIQLLVLDVLDDLVPDLGEELSFCETGRAGEARKTQNVALVFVLIVLDHPIPNAARAREPRNQDHRLAVGSDFHLERGCGRGEGGGQKGDEDESASHELMVPQGGLNLGPPISLGMQEAVDSNHSFILQNSIDNDVTVGFRPRARDHVSTRLPSPHWPSKHMVRR